MCTQWMRRQPQLTMVTALRASKGHRPVLSGQCPSFWPQTHHRSHPPPLKGACGMWYVTQGMRIMGTHGDLT